MRTRILTRSCRPRADGMLIYKQLGADAESQFAQQWGVGYAMDKCVARPAANLLFRIRVHGCDRHA